MVVCVVFYIGFLYIMLSSLVVNCLFSRSVVSGGRSVLIVLILWVVGWILRFSICMFSVVCNFCEVFSMSVSSIDVSLLASIYSGSIRGSCK